MDLNIGRAWGEGQWTATAALKPWSEVTSSDFYTWFGWHEVGRTDHGAGRVAIQLKPGGHQEAIDLVVALDAQQTVRLASLTLERPWMDGGMTAKSADDLAQSFLLAFAARHPEGAALARAIFDLPRGSQPIIRAADPGSVPPAEPSPVVRSGLDAYQNAVQAVEIMGADVTILLDNWRDMDAAFAGRAAATPGRRLIIEVLAALPPRPPFAATAPVIITGYPDSIKSAAPLGGPTTPPPSPPPPPVPAPPSHPIAPPPPPAAPPSGRRYDDLYLQTTEVPAGMTMNQDSRGRGADPGDTAFALHGGLDSGMTAWNGPQTAPINRLVDIRWVFPSAQAATAYHHETMWANAEHMAPVPNAPTVGTDCHVFGGLFEPLGPGTGLTSYFYLFTVGPVVVKLYAADFDGRSLRLELVTPIAQNIVRRISATLGQEQTPAKKPWWRFW